MPPILAGRTPPDTRSRACFWRTSCDACCRVLQWQSRAPKGGRNARNERRDPGSAQKQRRALPLLRPIA